MTPTMTALEYRAQKKSGSKYRNKITTFRGIKFRSKKEADRYAVLWALQEGSVISKLELQPRFPLIVDDVKVGLMVGDFRYVSDTGNDTVEDVKGAKTLLWRLKWNLAKVLYPHITWVIT